MGGAEYDPEIYLVHLKEGTTDDLLVVGILYDTSEHGNNIEGNTNNAPPINLLAVR